MAEGSDDGSSPASLPGPVMGGTGTSTVRASRGPSGPYTARGSGKTRSRAG